MLELRPNCECCDIDLPPDSRDAWICSFECTFCTSCVSTVLGEAMPQLWGRVRAATDSASRQTRHVTRVDQRVFNPECRGRA